MKKIFSIFSFLIISQMGFSQTGEEDYYGEEKTEKKDTVKKEEEPEKKFWDKCYTGGNVSLNIGSYGSYIEITPLLGYNLTDYWSIGVSASYKYFSGNNSAWGISYRTHVYGGSVFTRLLLGERFLVQAEMEMLNTEAYDVVQNKLVRKFIPIGLAGAGLRNGWGYNSYSYFLLMYDFIRDPASPYPFSPFVIKIGFVFPIRPQE